MQFKSWDFFDNSLVRCYHADLRDVFPFKGKISGVFVRDLSRWSGV